MLFKHKEQPQEKLQVDPGDLKEEADNLSKFLQTRLKTEVHQEKGKLIVAQTEEASLSELHHAVKKYIYHRDLNLTHYVSIEASTVKINRFKSHEKKKEKSKKEQPTKSLTQTWGL
ncbi:MAG: hypothetical protein NWE93_02230 [Candidatus Bathyarchaeota archaeon]|nr:hypothetical protein [Candidatus Bathyarchaeota archaeon]